MQRASSAENMFQSDAAHGKDGQNQLNDDPLAAFFDWGSFDAEASQQQPNQNGDFHNDDKPAASIWPPSRLSGESSACGWDENSPTLEHADGGQGLQSKMPPPAQQPPPPQQQQQQPQQQGGGFEAAWAAAQAAPHNAPWVAGPLHRGGSQTLGAPQPLHASYDSSFWPQMSAPAAVPGRNDMSWSLTRGLMHPTPQRSMVPGDAFGAASTGRLPPSHPLAGQLSGTYPSIQEFASHAEPQGRAAGKNSPHLNSPHFHPGQSMQQQQQQGSYPMPFLSHMAAQQPSYLSSAHSNSAAALRQLTEDELRRHVQQQVMTLIQTERDEAQLGWLHELLEMTKTSTLPLLGTLRQQLDVLLQPPSTQPPPPQQQQPVRVAEERQQQRSAPPLASATTSVYSDGWQSIINQAAAGMSLHQQQHPQHQQHQDNSNGNGYGGPVGGGSDARRSLSALPTSAQHYPHHQPHQQQLLQRAAGGSGQQAMSRGGAGACTSPSHRRLSMATASVCNGGSQSVREGASSGFVPTDEIGSHTTLSGRKRAGGAGGGGSDGEVVERRVKSDLAAATAGVMQFEPRWWRKQNNFTMTIDDIVKKMQSQGRLGPNGAAVGSVWQPMDTIVANAQPAVSSEFSGGGVDGEACHINAERVRQVYNKPLKDAAKLLSVSVMSLKRTCRKMGVRRWPYRKLASLTELEVTVRDDQLEQQLQPSDKEAVMQYIEAEKAAIMMMPDREVDPLLSDLRKAKIHMKYEKWGRKSLSRGTSNAQSQAASVSVGGASCEVGGIDAGADGDGDGAGDDLM